MVLAIMALTTFKIVAISVCYFFIFVLMAGAIYIVMHIGE